mmetsp:Transcript_294/g.665  ORF Transcript_294/g.665 Transcript_294/m.665 type:complete len:127 (+) Transcript_294:241-621(+)
MNEFFGMGVNTLGYQGAAVGRLAHESGGEVDFRSHDDVVGSNGRTDFTAEAFSEGDAEGEAFEFEVFESAFHSHGADGGVEAGVDFVAVRAEDGDEYASLVVEEHVPDGSVACVGDSGKDLERIVH